MPALAARYLDLPPTCIPRCAGRWPRAGWSGSTAISGRPGTWRVPAAPGGGDADRVRQDAVLQPAGAGCGAQRGAKALYLFPTKALAQDQVAELAELNRPGGAGIGGALSAGDWRPVLELGIKAFTFDGDTPGDARKAVRTRGDIVLSNPDMLHQAILPHHTKWAQFFESLAFVVVDELHGYRGVFGAMWPMCSGGCGASAASTVSRRASSSRPPPSPTRRAGRS
jgi:DEAD/DEAH box helicase domain-containing protein